MIRPPAPPAGPDSDSPIDDGTSLRAWLRMYMYGWWDEWTYGVRVCVSRMEAGGGFLLHVVETCCDVHVIVMGEFDSGSFARFVPRCFGCFLYPSTPGVRVHARRGERENGQAAYMRYTRRYMFTSGDRPTGLAN